MLERIRSLASESSLIEQALEQARERSLSDLEPVREAWQQTGEALRLVEAEIENLVGLVSRDRAAGALWEMLNEKAFRLKSERDQLLGEQRRLKALWHRRNCASTPLGSTRHWPTSTGSCNTLSPKKCNGC
jgi:hypothetical protein